MVFPSGFSGFVPRANMAQIYTASNIKDGASSADNRDEDKNDASFKVVLRAFVRPRDEISGKALYRDFTSVTVFKGTVKRVLWWRKKSWQFIGYYTQNTVHENKTVYLGTIEEVQNLLYTELGLTEENRHSG